DLARLNIDKELLQCRAAHRGAGEATVIIVLRETDPAFVALALDVGFARLPLGMQGVERLLQPFLGGFAGIDRAAEWPTAADRSGVIHRRSPLQRLTGISSYRCQRSEGRTSARR